MRPRAPILKGDSLRFDIDLFKSVYKVNVLIEGMQNIDNPEDFTMAEIIAASRRLG